MLTITKVHNTHPHREHFHSEQLHATHMLNCHHIEDSETGRSNPNIPLHFCLVSSRTPPSETRTFQTEREQIKARESSHVAAARHDTGHACASCNALRPQFHMNTRVCIFRQTLAYRAQKAAEQIIRLPEIEVTF